MTINESNGQYLAFSFFSREKAFSTSQYVLLEYLKVKAEFQCEKHLRSLKKSQGSD